MPLQELELIIKELNALAIRKRFADEGKRDKSLLLKTNRAILPDETIEFAYYWGYANWSS